VHGLRRAAEDQPVEALLASHRFEHRYDVLQMDVRVFVGAPLEVHRPGLVAAGRRDPLDVLGIDRVALFSNRPEKHREEPCLFPVGERDDVAFVAPQDFEERKQVRRFGPASLRRDRNVPLGRANPAAGLHEDGEASLGPRAGLQRRERGVHGLLQRHVPGSALGLEVLREALDDWREVFPVPESRARLAVDIEREDRAAPVRGLPCEKILQQLVRDHVTSWNEASVRLCSAERL
jgi:hypothetical protein